MHLFKTWQWGTEQLESDTKSHAFKYSKSNTNPKEFWSPECFEFIDFTPILSLSWSWKIEDWRLKIETESDAHCLEKT